MRKRFKEQLELIHLALVKMGGEIESALKNARVPVDRQKGLRKVEKFERKSDESRLEIERLSLNLLITQQPVAGDLRLISQAMRMAQDMERIGDMALGLVRMAMSNEDSFETAGLLIKLQGIASRMVTDSINSFVHSDIELAKSVIVSDDEADALFAAVKEELAVYVQKEPSRAHEVLDMLLMAKCFERIADHAVNIARAAIYTLTGSTSDIKESVTDGEPKGSDSGR